ncbi:helix-turn-helix transcriptional regulator [Sinanaerobacter sp. ZZT-01]|uniref:helix-turn-helix domain-containing protein n=1 Tax=Sinanaerobacter sp. ZZT-01 TaxID=3111540 RepID=UPI002D79BF09|nr:helix-turn-helix transcriptional regulator [Sinanaerobacter sp. ZZT-01]WRR94173.1 helix-turn-helix transcriptional regulator [Sinanaerobacter sp. ZZT-01]
MEAQDSCVERETALIQRLIEVRAEKGLSQRDLSALSGIRQSSIARLERMKATPQIDTLFKLLLPLGYTIEIVPFNKNREKECMEEKK